MRDSFGDNLKYASEASVDPTRRSDTIDTQLGELHGVLLDIGGIVDRLCGAQPPQGDLPQAVAAGLLEDWSMRLSAEINLAARLAERLSDAIRA